MSKNTTTHDDGSFIWSFSSTVPSGCTYTCLKCNYTSKPQSCYWLIEANSWHFCQSISRKTWRRYFNCSFSPVHNQGFFFLISNLAAHWSKLRGTQHLISRRAAEVVEAQNTATFVFWPSIGFIFFFGGIFAYYWALQNGHRHSKYFSARPTKYVLFITFKHTPWMLNEHSIEEWKCGFIYNGVPIFNCWN